VCYVNHSSHFVSALRYTFVKSRQCVVAHIRHTLSVLVVHIRHTSSSRCVTHLSHLIRALRHTLVTHSSRHMLLMVSEDPRPHSLRGVMKWYAPSRWTEPRMNTDQYELIRTNANQYRIIRNNTKQYELTCIDGNWYGFTWVNINERSVGARIGYGMSNGWMSWGAPPWSGEVWCKSAPIAADCLQICKQGGERFEKVVEQRDASVHLNINNEIIILIRIIITITIDMLLPVKQNSSTRLWVLWDWYSLIAATMTSQSLNVCALFARGFPWDKLPINHFES
jgi:hypothetical protein